MSITTFESNIAEANQFILTCRHNVRFDFTVYVANSILYNVHSSKFMKMRDRIYLIFDIVYFMIYITIFLVDLEVRSVY